MYRETAEQLLAFIEKSPSCFHAIKNMKDILLAEGFAQLREEDKWEIVNGGKYFVTRNDSSIVAFTIPETGALGYRIMASHSDSPTFKIKENPEMEVDKKYVKLNVERYGGMLCAPWFDRPLSVAGRVMVKTEKGVQTRMLFAGNLIKHPCFDEMRKNGKGYRTIGDLGNTNRIMRDTFWVGVYPGMNDEMIDYMAKTIREAIGQ